MIQYTSMAFLQSDLDDFKDLNRREDCFPSSYRFKACDAETGTMQRVIRTHYFPHLFVARGLLEQGLEVWQERYNLSKVKQPDHAYYRCNVEITERMGNEVKQHIEQAANSLDHEFRDPDLVTFDPKSKEWQFIEIKRSDTGDRLSDEQKNSLELLQRIVPNSTSIVLALSPDCDHLWASPIRTLLEQLAQQTWERLFWGDRLRCSQGETTITDHNLLEISRAKPSNIRVYKAHSRDEPKKGFDWEWWISSSSGGWWRFSVQAKRIDLSTTCYKHLRHRVGSTFQLQILDNFARSNNSIALYCFYNNLSDTAVAKRGWNCNLDFDAPQLGCTVAPIHVVRSVHRMRRRKDFLALHEKTATIPWRCLLCPNVVGQIRGCAPSILSDDFHPTPFAQLPSNLFQQDTDEEIELSDELYTSELGGFPKRIMVIDTS